jgi:hypothetical protein
LLQEVSEGEKYLYKVRHKANEKNIQIKTENITSIQGAQLSNSFILLMILNEAKEPLTLLRYLN